MFITIKLEGNVGTIHSINVDGEKIMPESKYNVAPHNFVHCGHQGFGLKEAVDRIIKNKNDIKNVEKAKIEVQECTRLVPEPTYCYL